MLDIDAPVYILQGRKNPEVKLSNLPALGVTYEKIVLTPCEWYIDAENYPAYFNRDKSQTLYPKKLVHQYRATRQQPIISLLQPLKILLRRVKSTSVRTE